VRVPRAWQLTLFAVLAVVLLGWAVVSAIHGNTVVAVTDVVLGLNCVIHVYRLSRRRRPATAGAATVRMPPEDPASVRQTPDRPPVPETVRARRERRERRMAGPDGRRRHRQ